MLEILITVAVLGVLATIVVVSVTGLMGRGQKESYDTDTRTIQTAVATFYVDTHSYSSIDGWNESDNYISMHNEPVANPTDSAALSLHLGDAVIINKYEVQKVLAGNRTDASDTDIKAAAIWMGLLNHGAGYGDAIGKGRGPDVAPGDYNSPLSGENGPYLNPLPQSCSTYNAGKATGTYTWIMLENGNVYGVSKINGFWYGGFNGRYP